MMPTYPTKFPVVLPFTLKGKILVLILRFFCKIIALFKGRKWASPLNNFEENPLFYTFSDILYFGYKYYYKPPFVFSADVVRYFQSQNLKFSLPEAFEVESEISISAGGDLMPYEWIQKPYTEHLWDDVGEYFFSSDIVFANLETPIYLQKPASLVPELMLSDMLFNGSAEMFDIFNGNGKYKGYNVLSTANNHSLDMGEEGVQATIDFLEYKKIAHTGTARSLRERENCPIIERNGIKIAFIAYTYSLNLLALPAEKSYLVNVGRFNASSPERCLKALGQDVRNAKNRGADLVILSLHTGNAYQAYPSEHTMHAFHKIFEVCGVDAILGSHPHNPQPMEKYTFQCPYTKQIKQGFAIYSLADFVAYDIFVWDRLVPLLKIYVQKGKINGASYTQISRVEVKAVYNWGEKDQKKARQMRFLDLEKLIESIRKGKAPIFLSELCKKEAIHLYTHWKKYFVI